MLSHQVKDLDGADTKKLKKVITKEHTSKDYISKFFKLDEEKT
jgi:hypothetical protein